MSIKEEFYKNGWMANQIETSPMLPGFLTNVAIFGELNNTSQTNTLYSKAGVYGGIFLFFSPNIDCG